MVVPLLLDLRDLFLRLVFVWDGFWYFLLWDPHGRCSLDGAYLVVSGLDHRDMTVSGQYYVLEIFEVIPHNSQ